MLTIVAYHYVRDISTSRFPKLPALDTARFERQLDHLAAAYRVIGLDDLQASLSDGRSLPDNCCLLTFDDGYRDHVEVVMPALIERGWSGVFFPAADAVSQRQLLEVNAIQFIVASYDDREALAEELAACIEARRDETTPSLEKLRDTWFAPGRWDDSPTRFVKGVLQQGLPADQRAAVIAQLFQRHVSDDPVSFADALYLSQSDLTRMLDAGMKLGSHGACHRRMTKLDDVELEADLNKSLVLLRQCGASVADGWALCYPHGAHDERVRAVARQMGCGVAVTVESRLADLALDDPLALPRLDTNDVPL